MTVPSLLSSSSSPPPLRRCRSPGGRIPSPRQRCLVVVGRGGGGQSASCQGATPPRADEEDPAVKTRPVACEEGLVHQSRGDADCACSPARRPGTAMGAGGCQWRCQGRGGRAPHSAGRSCPPSSSMMAGRKGPRNCAIATHYRYLLFTLPTESRHATGPLIPKHQLFPLSLSLSEKFGGV